MSTRLIGDDNRSSSKRTFGDELLDQIVLEGRLYDAASQLSAPASKAGQPSPDSVGAK